jgi:hypothetical protein
VSTTTMITTNQTSLRPLQHKEVSTGKKAQVKRYPRSRTEQESGKVDSQGSQRWQRRKRDKETLNAAAEGGGGL